MIVERETGQGSELVVVP
jgi:hypothetical protein